MRFLGPFSRFAWQHNSLRYGLIIIVAWGMIALLAPVISPFSPIRPHPDDTLEPPSREYLLGTDRDGFDILSRLLWAPRIDLGIAVTSTAISFLIGVVANSPFEAVD